jgi:hypothetical protein
MRWLRVVGLVLVLGTAAAAPALAYEECYSYRTTICDNYECCTSRCTECDYYSPNGDFLGYAQWCSDEGCLPRGV